MRTTLRLANGEITAVETGPAALRQGLNELSDLIAEAGFNLDILLLPGLDKERIHEAFTAVGLIPPNEVVEFYQWHNGYAPSVPPSWPIPEVTLAPLEVVLRRYHDQYMVKGTSLELDAPMIILEADVRGHAVVCDAQPEESPVILYFDEDNHRHLRTEPIGRSMCTWVQSWILRIRAGVYEPILTDEFGLQWRRDINKARAFNEGPVLP